MGTPLGGSWIKLIGMDTGEAECGKSRRAEDWKDTNGATGDYCA